GSSVGGRDGIGRAGVVSGAGTRGAGGSIEGLGSFGGAGSPGKGSPGNGSGGSSVGSRLVDGSAMPSSWIACPVPYSYPGSVAVTGRGASLTANVCSGLSGAPNADRCAGGRTVTGRPRRRNGDRETPQAERLRRQRYRSAPHDASQGIGLRVRSEVS